MSVGKLIREERKKLGWSQEKLAQYLKISRITLGKYEREEQILDFGTFLKLLDLFQLSADSFLERDTKKALQDQELKFMEELRKEERVYYNALKYPKLEIQKLKNLY